MQITKIEFLELLKPYSKLTPGLETLLIEAADENLLAFITKEVINNIWLADDVRNPNHFQIRYQMNYYNNNGYFNFTV